ncbi:GNAT family N-acetyltransferase [Thalassotalea psychrophila]|uniref:GNAT family N-acetyltransferase n=1 Tax=Thalassotalea psychrophila TaxID=3065647 RepID=A0ABY9TQG0_9GAMM|nr:GNAT family N-acetyltransferase [Colwelliaceae bacterium SQ149]
MTEFTATFATQISHVNKQHWQAIFHDSYPFYQYPFLHALEQSGAVSSASGWQPQHLLIHRENTLIAAMPCYLKQHSYGEYMFDWSWADAYQAHGISYYPKLLSAIPFTPATGKRIGIHPDFEQFSQKILALIVGVLEQTLDQIEASNFQCLFLDKTTSDSLAKLGLIQRTDVQYHWLNKGYLSFSDFLSRMTARKRKMIKKERQNLVQHKLNFVWCNGEHITKQDWSSFYSCYQQTYLKRSGHQGYLNLEFFTLLSEQCADSTLLLKVINDKQEVVASSLFFKSDTHLYGRYWGCIQEHEFLHFEACYYQGIEYCIKHNLQCFDAGAQGEHKLARGFEPVKLYGNYLIPLPNFKHAIADFIEKEQRYHNEYMQSASSYLPFKTDS